MTARTPATIMLLCASLAHPVAAQNPVPAPTGPRPLEAALAAPTASQLRSHVRYLSDDLLEGRAPGTRGGELAARYIAAQFEAAGLEPAGPNQSFFQPVNLVGVTPEPSLIVGVNRQTVALTYLDDFVAWPVQPDSTLTLDGDLVFVGFGVQAQQWNWDDYKGTPLAGKILLMLVNDPGSRDSTIFNGSALTYYGRWTYKLEQAARMGASGVLLIHTDASASYPWSVVRSTWSGEQVQLDRHIPQALRFGAWITDAAARRLVESTGKDYDLMVRRAGLRDFLPVSVGAHLVLDMPSRVRRFTSANVVARLDGGDPAARDQAVVMTAHYDHLGIRLPVRGDSIYNGAVDNASGVSVLLTAAAAFARAPQPPHRSLLFVATTAEEGGSLGAQTYVGAPLAPLARTAAVINIDGANLRGRTTDAVALGADQSSLESVFAAAAAAENLTAAPDPEPRAGFFYRSDQLPFAQAGVPALALRPGAIYVGHTPDWGVQQAEKYTRERYRQPSDEFSADFDYQGALQQTRLLIRLAWAVANAPQLPAWTQASDFWPAGQRLRGQGREPSR